MANVKRFEMLAKRDKQLLNNPGQSFLDSRNAPAFAGMILLAIRSYSDSFRRKAESRPFQKCSFARSI